MNKNISNTDKIQNWNDFFTPDIKNWLLDEVNPSVRYFTLVNLLEKPKSDKNVVECKKYIMQTDPVKKILAHQQPDGSFLTPNLAKKSPTIVAKIGYQPKYKGTVWQAIFLAQLGVVEDDSRIKKLCEYILNTNYFSDLEVFGLNFYKSERRLTTVPCYVANMVWALSKLGFFNDSRIQNSIKWILKYQRFDDGDFKTPDFWPYRGRADRCFGKHSCYIGCTQTLKAMTVIPVKNRTKEINKFIEKAVGFILLHKIYKKSRGKPGPIKREYESLTFPSYYYDDILQILDTLLELKVKSIAIDDAIRFILEKRQESEKWILECTIRPSALYAKFEEKGTESRWITYKVLSMLKKYNESN